LKKVISEGHKNYRKFGTEKLAVAWTGARTVQQ
jgi:hypothetical protein